MSPNNEIIFELSTKRLIQLTTLFMFLALAMFLASCQMSEPYGNRVGHAPLPNIQPTPSYANKGISQNNSVNKGQEQLYIKRDQLSIQPKEFGSSSGSIWADSSLPKSLATEFKPTRPGEVVTVNIPENLQFKDEAAKTEPAKSFKFEVAGIEPGGEVYLRGVKNYTAENGEQRNIIILAKIPRRDFNNSEINAKDLTEVAVHESSSTGESDYSSTGWDQTVSKKIAGYTPDVSTKTAALESEKKEVETQKKALADQQKALTDESERLKKDRKRLDAETARATNTQAKAPSAPQAPAAAPAANNAGAAKP
ncbi:MAG: hypothetical protein V4591_01955 [Bdellovibrionota bacterium]